MQKHSETDWNKVLRATGTGVAAGGASAAILDLLHYIQEQNRLTEEAATRNDTDKNTLVVTLPADRLAKESAVSTMGGPITPSTGTTRTKNVAQTSSKGNVQLRKNTGTFLPSITKSCATSAPTYIGEGLGLLGGAGIGYLTVDKLYAMLRKRQLKQELEESKQEYFRSLFGSGEKTASMDKESVNSFNKVLAGYVLLSLMGTGAVGYLTKKVLDEKFKEPDVQSTMPRVKKIVFKTAPGPVEDDIEEQKMATDKVIACLGVELYSQKPECGILDSIEVKTALNKAGLNKYDLMAMSKSATFTENFIEGALSNDNLRNSLVNSTMDKMPVLGRLWEAVDGNNMFSGFAREKAKEAAMQKIQNSKTLSVLSSAANLADYIPGGQWAGAQAGRLAGSIGGHFSKQSHMDPADFATSLMDNIEDQGAPVDNNDQGTDPYIKNLEKDIKLKQLAKPVVNDVSIVGADPNAQGFVNAKKDKIKGILRTMISDKEL